MLLLGHDIHHKTIGIIGFGRIGYAVAKRAKGFDMKIIYTDVDDKPYAKELGAERVDMDTLLSQSDFISLHPFLDPSTTHMIDEPQFKKMKKNAIIINAARGPVINEKVLVQALKEGWIAGAGLDVVRLNSVCLGPPTDVYWSVLGSTRMSRPWHQVWPSARMQSLFLTLVAPLLIQELQWELLLCRTFWQEFVERSCPLV